MCKRVVVCPPRCVACCLSTGRCKYIYSVNKSHRQTSEFDRLTPQRTIRSSTERTPIAPVACFLVKNHTKATGRSPCGRPYFRSITERSRRAAAHSGISSSSELPLARFSPDTRSAKSTRPSGRSVSFVTAAPTHRASVRIAASFALNVRSPLRDTRPAGRVI